MSQSWFAWNGVDCRSMGVTLTNVVPIVWPEERVEHITIPGRPGDLTDLEGTDIYNSYIQTASIRVKDGWRARQVKSWLRGAGTVTFSGEPEVKQQARIIGAVTLERVSLNLDIWVGEVQFYCQPLKQRLIEPTATVALNGSIYNAGDVTEKPIFILSATASTVVITAGGKSLTITGLTSGDGLHIDSESMMVLSADLTEDLTAQTTGFWPVLNVGENTLAGSGWSSCQVRRRERFF